MLSSVAIKEPRISIQKVFYLEFFLSLLFLLFLCWMLPLCGDDWYYESVHIRQPVQIMTFSRYYRNNYNGRLLGNMLAALLGGHAILRCLFKALTLWFISIIVYRLSNIRSAWFYPLVLSVIVAVPFSIFAQVYAMAAGFYNYVPGILLIMLYIYTIQPLLKSSTKTPPKISEVAAFFSCLAAQLFVENVTCANIVITVFIVVYYRIHFGKWSRITILGMTAAVLGAFIMFSAPVYWNGKGNYQSIGISLLLSNYIKVSDGAILGYLPLFLTINGLVLFQLGRLECRQSWMIIPLVVIIAGASVYFIVTRNLFGNDISLENSMKKIALDMLIFLGWLSAVSVILILNQRQKGDNIETIIFWLAAVSLDLPLLVVSPLNARCYFGSYLFLLLLVFRLFDECELVEHANLKLLRSFYLTVSGCVLIFYLLIFTKIAAVTAIREEQISLQMQSRAQVISLPAYPFSEIICEPDSQKLGILYYYEKPYDITFSYTPFYRWTS